MNLRKNVTYTTKTITNVLKYNNEPVIKYTINYPEFYSKNDKRVIKKINSYYEKQAQNYKRYIENTMFNSAIDAYDYSKMHGYPFNQYEAILTFTITYNKNCALSLYQQKYEYTGGAHGITIQTSQTWNLNNGNMVELGDLFPTNPNYIRDIKGEIISQIEKQIAAGQNFYFDNYKELVNKTFNKKSFYLTNEGINIYFQQYDIAPYASGIPTFTIPFCKVNAKLWYCEM